MIKAQNVVKWFGPKLAVDDVSFTVDRGEVLAFLGPNGAGKSTTMRILTGFLPFAKGKVEIGGHDIENDSIAAKSLIGYLPENAPAYPEMTVNGFLHFVAELRGMKSKDARAAVDRVIEICFLEPVRYQPVDTLSKGYRHRTGFAQSILHDPPILILDEPTDGLDPNQKHEVRELIKSMGKEKAIIISTHILEEVDAICSRVIIIDRGKLVFNGSPDDLRSRSAASGTVVVRVLEQTPQAVKEFFGGMQAVDHLDILSEESNSQVFRVYGNSKGKQKLNLAKQIAHALAENGWAFDELHTDEGRLDEVFRSVTLSETVEESK